MESRNSVDVLEQVKIITELLRCKSNSNKSIVEL